MTSGSLSLSEANRPRHFADFIGKSRVVKYLTKQINEESGRSVLLHGAAGCGKSSLARVYAAGLLCEARENGPCYKCGSCSQLLEGRHLNLRALEFGRLPDEQFADEINKDLRNETMGNGRFVVLINRANLLSSKALELLHDQMKRSYVGVTFILCADDIDALPQKTSALFFPLEVRRPTFSDATAYIRLLCDKSGLAFDEEGIEALADFSRSSYQVLALDLEVLSQRGKLASADVVEHFLSSPMVKYVDQVIDRAPFSDQLSTLEQWSLPPSQKIDRIGRYLSDIFDLQCGLRPGCLRWSEGFADLSDRIGAYARAMGTNPRAFITQMLQVWDPEPMAGPTTLRRKASAFDELLTVAALDVSQPEQAAQALRQKIRRTRQYEETDAVARRRAPEIPVQQDTAASLTLTEARKLWDAASYMVQAYGVLLNTGIVIHHAKLDLRRGKLAEHVVTDFLHQLRMFVARARTEPMAELHTLYAHQTDNDGHIVTRIVAHIPRCKRDPKVWVAGFAKRHATEASLEGAVDIHIEPEKNTFLRHLELIQSICAGLMPVSPAHQVFLRRAKIDARRIGWSAGAKPSPQRVGLSRLIDKEEQAKASEDLKVLYAFNEAGADPCSGWELQEYRYRRKIMEQRRMLEDSAADRQDGGLAVWKVRDEWKRAAPMRQSRRPGFS